MPGDSGWGAGLKGRDGRQAGGVVVDRAYPLEVLALVSVLV